MNCLVTGGAGFIGSHLTELLLQSGHQVTVLDNFSSGHEAFLPKHERLEIVRGDIRDQDTLRKVLPGRDWVFHQAALRSVPRSVEQPLEYGEVNIQGTLKLLVACRDAKVQSFILASSSSVYGDYPTFPQKEGFPPAPVSPYAASKLAGEALCRVFSKVYGLKTASLRYFNVYGPRQDPLSEYAAVVPRFIVGGLRREPLEIHWDGEQARDFTYVRDCARANLLAAQQADTAGEVYNVAGGEAITVNRIADLVEEILGYKLERRYAPKRAGDIRKTWADMGKAKEKMGFEPSVIFREGLEETVQYFENK